MSPRATRGRRHRRRLHPLAIAAITIALVAAVVFYAFNQGLPFVHHFTLRALVSNSVNLRTDSPVRIAGIDVGSVTGTAPRGRATEVSFTLDGQGLPVHEDATLRIRSRLFLEGGYYLELDPGTPAAPVAPDGFTIPEQNTTAPVQFYNVLSTFNAASRDSLQHLLDTLNQGFSPLPGHPPADSGSGALKAAIPQLTPVLKDTALVSRALRGTRPGDVETLLSSGADVAGTLAGNEDALIGLVHGLYVSSSAVQATDGAVAATLRGLDSLLRTAPGDLATIDRALPPVTRLANALDPSLKLAPPIVSSVTGAVRQLAAVVAPAIRGPLIRSLNATFSQFPATLTLVAAVFPQARQVTDCLASHVTPALKRTVPDGALSTGRPVWQDFVHFLPNIAAASGTFDANGPYTRVLAGAGTNTLSGGILGSLLGNLGSTAPSGGGTLVGAAPKWAGTLTADAFHPEVPCTSQAIPSFAATPAAPDLRPGRGSAPRPLSRADLGRLLAPHRSAIAGGGAQ